MFRRGLWSVCAAYYHHRCAQRPVRIALGQSSKRPVFCKLTLVGLQEAYTTAAWAVMSGVYARPPKLQRRPVQHMTRPIMSTEQLD